MLGTFSLQKLVQQGFTFVSYQSEVALCSTFARQVTILSSYEAQSPARPA
jgi:hypothetical protein